MNNHILRYNNPADIWENAMLLGNGQIGAVCYGSIEHETICLNHDTFWSGYPNPEIKEQPEENLKTARELLFEEKYSEAENFMLRNMMATPSEAYLPVGYLNLHFQEVGGMYEGYYRTLNMQTAVAEVSYKRNSSRIKERCPSFKRTMFVSKPHNLFVMKITTDVENSINLTVGVSSDAKSETVAEGNRIFIKGKAPSNLKEGSIKHNYIVYDDSKQTVEFNMLIHIEQSGGEIYSDNGTLKLFGCNEVVIYTSIDTSFVSFNKAPDKKMECEKYIENALKIGYDELLCEHMKDYMALYSRVDIDLGDDDTGEYTDLRLEKFRNGEPDNGIYELLFNVGRYLTIAASRQGTEPTNLFGIWSGIFRQMWGGNYTVNINTEMNYWGTESCNLSECHEPMLRFIEELSVSGEEVAKKHFGCRGFCVNHNVDLWRHALPIHAYPTAGYWPMAGGWMSRHLYEHYLYTGDKEFLKEKAFPITEKAALFLLDWLQTDKNGYYVTVPSTTPENQFIDENGKRCGVSIATTMDMSIVKDCFRNLLEIAEILEISTDVTNKVSAIYDMLYPFNIASDGTLMEWYKEFTESDPGHRHFSHLYSVFPARLINEDTPKLFEAAKNSLDKRLSSGSGSTGWSAGWTVHLYANMKQAEKAGKALKDFICSLIYDSGLDCHPPFQIDGNFALMSGVCEMLMQSTADSITLLPSVSPEWKSGSFKGLKARGGYTVSAKWSDGVITEYEIVGYNGRAISSRKPTEFGTVIETR